MFAGRRELLALLVVGFIFSLGPVNTFGEVVVPMPLYPFYKYVPGFHMFRIPGRTFSLMLLAVAICAARGLERLLEVLQANENSTPQQLKQAVLEALTQFSGKSLSHDDVTLMAVKID